MLDLIGNFGGRFSHNEAHIIPQASANKEILNKCNHETSINSAFRKL